MTLGVLYVVVTGAGATRQVPTLFLPPAAERGWDVRVLATGQAASAFPESMAQIEEVTGHPVRTGFHTTVGYSLPDPDALVVAPATYNTLTKWALGIADTYVLTRLAEQVGRRVPIVAAPYVHTRFAAHPTYEGSLATLKQWGVRLVIGPGEPHEPGAAEPDDFPWAEILETVTSAREGAVTPRP
ncbi:flavoprotein [Promicromonospora kroppenstedtii]|uniref:flavoprotein n=1 Tax=Promicromonospora kroppenstedtii TaxID=440482 RepID=UPI0004AD090D|nr:flavoprotein [Promicromonospora kroppenstedtii]